MNQLSGWRPETRLPPVQEAERRHLLEQICLGAVSFQDLKNRDVKGVVHSWLSAARQACLDKHAPERLRLSNGRHPKMVYVAHGPPYLAARIQELYDVQSTPRVAMGRVPVVIHIVAPNYRPVQITQDLAGFWSEHYRRMKQQLQRRYPKHEWR